MRSGEASSSSKRLTAAGVWYGRVGDRVEILFEAIAEGVEGDHLLRDARDEAHVDVERREESNEVLRRSGRCSESLLACVTCEKRVWIGLFTS